MLTGWRIAAPDYSSSVKEMLSGEGAFLFGGRWNNKGTRVVYLGTSLAQASMELLVHLGRNDVLKTYKKLSVAFDESLMQHIDLTDLPGDWASPSMTASVQRVGDTWVAGEASLILQVPSAAVVGEYNYLFNPEHPDADKAIYGVITPYGFDPRILK